MISKNRGVEFITDSIDVYKTRLNVYKDTGRPRWFDSDSKEGVSDHFPIVAKITLE